MRESGEMYLETILVLSKKGTDVHSVDVSEYMGYSKPSVSRAVGLLKEKGLITVDQGGVIRLTKEGQCKAESIYERHTVLTEALMMIGVDEEAAAEDACKMEHYISERSFAAIKDHVKRYRSALDGKQKKSRDEK